MICSTPRSGTTWLCDVVANTNELGYPGEYFADAQTGYYERLLGRKAIECYPAVFDLILRLGSTPNKTFAVKLFWPFLHTLASSFHRHGENLGQDGLDILKSYLPEISLVRLVREDKLRQAISLYRATKTNVWWKNKTVPVNRDTPIPFDYQAIRAMKAKIIREEQAWSHRLASYDVPQLLLTYSSIRNDPRRSLARLSHFTKCESLAVRMEGSSDFEIQADEITDDWEVRFNDFAIQHSEEPASS